MSLDLEETSYAELVQARPWSSGRMSALSGMPAASMGHVASMGSASEPAVFKDGVFLAPMIVLLQAMAPAVVAVGTLYLATQLFAVTFNNDFLVLAVLVGALSLVMMKPRRDVISDLLTSWPALTLSLCVRWGLLLAVLMTVGYLTQHVEEYSRRVLVSWAAATPALMATAMLLLQKLAQRCMVAATNTRRVIFVGANEISRTLAERLTHHTQLCTSVAGFFDDRSRTRLGEHGQVRLLGTLSEVPRYVREHEIDAIYIALPLRDVYRVQQLVTQLHDTTVSTYYLPDVPLHDPVHRARPCELLGVPVVALCETPFYGCRGAIKRLMDIVMGSILLAVLAPLLLLIAAAVKRSSAGPAIFRQRRYGLNGQEIVVYKFRTMTVTEDGGELRQATRDDARITSVGRILRRYSLDELPQLINVLQGRMSLVGPRPHAVAHNEEYRKLIRGYMIRHKMLPGMTGLAQVNGCRGEILQLDDLQARVRLDLEYLSHWSPLLDLKILAQTALIVFRDEKAY